MSTNRAMNEAVMAAAIADVRRRRFKSIRATAAYYRVERTTLQRRLRGQANRTLANAAQQLLLPEQEEILYLIVRDLARQHMPCTASLIQDLAFKIGSLSKRPGNSWYRGFLRRWPALNTGRGRVMSASRVIALTPAIVDHVFDILEYHEQQNSIPQSRVWNMDETGFQQGQRQGEPIVYDRYDSAPAIARSDTTQWSTVIECANALGETIPPMVIHTGKQINDDYFPTERDISDGSGRDFSQWRWAFSLKGWSDQELALIWLRTMFIRNVQPSKERPVILILDNHDSHCSGEFLVEAYLAGIKLVYIPPHSSHKLQPLDLGAFSRIKKYYSDGLKSYIPTGQLKVNRLRFNLIYEKARRQAMVPTSINAGWKRAGIFPRKRGLSLEDHEVASTLECAPAMALPADYEPRAVTPPEDGINQRIVRQLYTNHEAIHASPRSMRKIRHLVRAAIRSDAEASGLRQGIQMTRQAAKSAEDKRKRERLANEEIERTITFDEVMNQRFEARQGGDTLRILRARRAAK